MRTSIVTGLVKAAVCLSFLFSFTAAHATHLAGGGLSYEYLGNNNYKVTLMLFQDCMTGDPEAIREDNPAFLFVFTGTGVQYKLDSLVSQNSVNSPIDYQGCSTPSATCVKKVTASKTISLPASASGYIIVWQRCCRNGDVVNIGNPGGVGATYTCQIPPVNLLTNKSAVFGLSSSAQHIVCTNSMFSIGNSATDADGDSLSYEFSPVYIGGLPDNAKPRQITPPPYQPVSFKPGYSYTAPIGGTPAIEIDAVTGVMTGTPNLAGKYLVAIACNEWRGGVKINTVRNEYEVLVTNCGTNIPEYVLDTTILLGQTINFSAPAGGTSYAWHPGIFLSDSTIANPVGFFPYAGNFSYAVHNHNASGCTRVDTVQVHVIPAPVMFMPTAFTPNGDGVNDLFKPMSVGPYVMKYLKVYDRNGQMISDNTNGWDGNYKDMKEPMGTYVWMMQYLDKDGAIHNTKGTVTLVR